MSGAVSAAEERAQLGEGFIGCLLRHIVSAGEGTAADIVGPVAPDGEHVVPRFELALPAPQREERATDAPSRFAVGLVMREVQRRGGAIVLADGVPRRGVAETAQILGERLRGKEIARLRLARGVAEP